MIQWTCRKGINTSDQIHWTPAERGEGKNQVHGGYKGFVKG